MKRALWLQETRLMRFEEAYEDWTEKRLTQEEAASLLGVCSRTFRRYVHRYEEESYEGLLDRTVYLLATSGAVCGGTNVEYFV